MAALPYITSPGNISKALDGISKASVPERVSGDFVKTVLKIPGGSGDQVTTFLKKIGFSDTSGNPTDRYVKFRNPHSSGEMVADALKDAYKPLYVRNEFMHKLSDDELIGLIVEETGLSYDSNPVKLTIKCIQALKSFADFEVENSVDTEPIENSETNKTSGSSKANTVPSQLPINAGSVGLNLGYTINLNLPPTSDIAVFDAIFQSLRKNLMSPDDA